VGFYLKFWSYSQSNRRKRNRVGRRCAALPRRMHPSACTLPHSALGASASTPPGRPSPCPRPKAARVPSEPGSSCAHRGVPRAHCAEPCPRHPPAAIRRAHGTCVQVPPRLSLRLRVAVAAAYKSLSFPLARVHIALAKLSAATRHRRRPCRRNSGHESAPSELVVLPNYFPGEECRRPRRIPVGRATPVAEDPIARFDLFLGIFMRTRGIVVNIYFFPGI
jgi:hypothetical protein